MGGDVPAAFAAGLKRWPTLKAFAAWWLEQDHPPRLAPVYGWQRSGPGSAGTIICRIPPYQVEAIAFRPGHVVPPHKHPNLDSYDFHVAGSGSIRLAGRDLPPRAPLDGTEGPAALLRGRVPVLRGVVHSGKAGPAGASFYSLQRWHVWPMGFITDDWQDAA